MSSEAENIALFDRFLQGDMSETERNAFTKRCADDAEFNAEFEAFKSLESLLIDAEITQFKNQLNDWDKDAEKDKKKSRIIRLQYIAVAASIAILATVSTYFLFQGSSNAQLVENHFTPYENIVTIRGDKAAIDDGLALYDTGDFDEALVVFDALADDITAEFYKAESLMALKRYPEAAEVYEQVLESPSVFSDVAAFHLALCFVGQNKDEEAIKHLEQIPESSDYYAEAREILADLR